MYLALAMSAKTSLAATATTLTLLSMTASAWAAGNFTIKTTTVAESSGEWHIKVA